MAFEDRFHCTMFNACCSSLADTDKTIVKIPAAKEWDDKYADPEDPTTKSMANDIKSKVRMPTGHCLLLMQHFSIQIIVRLCSGSGCWFYQREYFKL